MSLFQTLRYITGHPLCRDRPLAAIGRFIRWQMGSRLLPGEILFRWVNKSRFIVRSGEAGLTGNVYTGLHEFEDMAYLLHVLRPGDGFIDAGANVGAYTILAGAVLGARCYAFEPVPDTYKRLLENIRVNGLDCLVRCFNLGLSSQAGQLRFSGDQDTENHALLDGQHASLEIEVAVDTLDNVCTEFSPAIIKIDVEGFETAVLEGARTLLDHKDLHSVIMELNGSGTTYGYDESAILDLMAGYGFDTYAYNPFTRKLHPLNGKNASSGNTLFVRNLSYVEQRLHDAERIEVNGVSF